MYTPTLVLIYVAAVAVVDAQPVGIIHNYSLSDTCKSSILAFKSSAVSTCLAIPGLPSGQEDWLDPASDWLNKVCDLEDCNSEALATAVTNVVDACKPDLNLMGYDETQLYPMSETIPLYFKIAKNALCVRDKSNGNSLCVRDLALKIKEIFRVTYNPAEAYVDLNNILSLGTDNRGHYPSEIICDKCVLGIYNQVKEGVPAVTTIEENWNAQCGASFTSTVPKDLVVSLPQNSGNDTNGAPSQTQEDSRGNTNGASLPLQTRFAQLAAVVLAGVFSFNI